MSDIQKDLDSIMKARYGKDVRQAIHDGILDCHEDANMAIEEAQRLSSSTEAALKEVETAVEVANQAAETAQASITNLTEEAATAIETTNAASSTATQAAKEAQDAAQEAREASTAVLNVNIATDTTPGIVKATEDITVAEDGSMTLDTGFTMPEEISEIVSGENWKLILGKIAKLMENCMDKTLADQIYPVGSIYMSVNSVNPSQLFGGTWETWGSGKVPVGIDTADNDFETVEKTGGEKTHTLTEAQMPKHTHTFTGSSVKTSSQSNTSTSTESAAHTHSVYYYTTSTTQSQYKNAENMTIWTNKYSTAGDNMLTESSNHTHTYEHTHNITAAGTNSQTGSGSAHNNLQPYITCYMWKRTA